MEHDKLEELHARKVRLHDKYIEALEAVVLDKIAALKKSDLEKMRKEMEDAESSSPSRFKDRNLMAATSSQGNELTMTSSSRVILPSLGVVKLPSQSKERNPYWMYAPVTEDEMLVSAESLGLS